MKKEKSKTEKEIACFCGKKDEKHFFKAEDWTFPREWYWKRLAVDRFDKTRESSDISRFFFSLGC